MTGAELRAALDELHIEPVDLARKCGVLRKTVYRWYRDGKEDSLPVPQYVETIIDLMRELSKQAPEPDLTH